MEGPHLSNANADSGSLSVILVVILPVLQMFLFVALIILVRMCYRNYCRGNNATGKNKPLYHAPRSTFNLSPNKCYAKSKTGPSIKETVLALTSSSNSISEILSPVNDRKNNATNEPIKTPALVRVTAQKHDFSETTLGPSSVVENGVLQTFTISHGVTSPTPSTQPVYTVPPDAYQVSAISGARSSSIFPTGNLVSQTHSLPINTLLPSQSLSHYQRTQLHRSNTLNDGIESLNSDAMDTDDEARGISLPVDFEPLCQPVADLPLRRNSSHQSECIYHPRNSISRPTSANSGTIRCMQTY